MSDEDLTAEAEQFAEEVSSPEPQEPLVPDKPQQAQDTESILPTLDSPAPAESLTPAVPHAVEAERLEPDVPQPKAAEPLTPARPDAELSDMLQPEVQQPRQTKPLSMPSQEVTQTARLPVLEEVQREDNQPLPSLVDPEQPQEPENLPVESPDSAVEPPGQPEPSLEVSAPQTRSQRAASRAQGRRQARRNRLGIPDRGQQNQSFEVSAPETTVGTPEVLDTNPPAMPRDQMGGVTGDGQDSGKEMMRIFNEMNTHLLALVAAAEAQTKAMEELKTTLASIGGLQ